MNPSSLLMLLNARHAVSTVRVEGRVAKVHGNLCWSIGWRPPSRKLFPALFHLQTTVSHICIPGKGSYFKMP